MKPNFYELLDYADEISLLYASVFREEEEHTYLP